MQVKFCGFMFFWGSRLHMLSYMPLSGPLHIRNFYGLPVPSCGDICSSFHLCSSDPEMLLVPKCTKLFLDFISLFMLFLLPAFLCSPAGHILKLLQTQSWPLCTGLSPYWLHSTLGWSGLFLCLGFRGS